MAKEFKPECKECHREYKTMQGLARHISRSHKPMSSKEYFDKHLKDVGDGKCVVCSKPTTFENIRGYAPTCSHACGTVKFQAELKTDQTRFSQFVQRTSESQAKVWANRSLDEKREIFHKITSSHGYRVRSKPIGHLKHHTELNLEPVSRQQAKMIGFLPAQNRKIWDQVQDVVFANLTKLFLE